jgi:hypothetical protein
MKQVAAEELKFAADAESIFFVEMQVVKNVEMKIEDGLRFPASVGELSASKCLSNREKPIGNAFHGGDDYGDAGRPRGRADETRGMEHAVGAEKRAAAKLKRDDFLRLRPRGFLVHRGAPFCGAAFREYFFLNVFETHDPGSWFCSKCHRGGFLEGALKKKPTARFASGGGLETFC